MRDLPDEDPEHRTGAAEDWCWETAPLAEMDSFDLPPGAVSRCMGVSVSGGYKHELDGDLGEILNDDDEERTLGQQIDELGDDDLLQNAFTDLYLEKNPGPDDYECLCTRLGDACTRLDSNASHTTSQAYISTGSPDFAVNCMTSDGGGSSGTISPPLLHAFDLKKRQLIGPERRVYDPGYSIEGFFDTTTELKFRRGLVLDDDRPDLIHVDLFIRMVTTHYT